MIVIRRIFYIITFLTFLLTGTLTLYYGKETFHLGSNSRVDSIPDQKAYHFVLIPEELDNEYWFLVEEGARDAAKLHDVYLEYLGPKQADIDEHLKTIDMAIAGRVDGIMTQGISDEEFTPLLNKAVKNGIPVVTVDTDAPNSNREVYIGTDNYYAGFLAGKALIQDTKGQQNVAIITGRFEASHQKLRVQGFKDAVQNEKRIKIIAVEESNISKIGAIESTYNLLKEYPDLNAFYGTSALDGIGIAQVVERLKSTEDLYIMAFDTLPDTLSYIEKGTIDATVVQFPYQMGYQAVEKLIELQEGSKQENIQHTKTEIFRKEDLPLLPALIR